MTTTTDALAMRASLVHQCEGTHAKQRCTATINHRATLCTLCQIRKDKADRKVAQQREFRQNKREREAQGLSTVMQSRTCDMDDCENELRWNNKSGICYVCARRKRAVERMRAIRAEAKASPPALPVRIAPRKPRVAKLKPAAPISPALSVVTAAIASQEGLPVPVAYVPPVREVASKPAVEPATVATVEEATAQGKRLYPTRGFEIHERAAQSDAPMFRTTRIDATVERGWTAHSAHTYYRGQWNVVDLKTPTRAAKRFLHGE